MISSALALLAGGFLMFGTVRSLAQRQTPVWVSRAVQLSGAFSALWGLCRLVIITPLIVSDNLAFLIQRLGFYAGGGFVGIWLLIIINGELKAMLSRRTNEAEETRPPNLAALGCCPRASAKHMKPGARRILSALFALISFPCFLLTLLVCVSLVNPMGLMFLTSFTITNDSGEAVFVTPIGAVGEQGDRFMLPLSVSEFPYLMKVKTGNFKIPPGESRSFTYDWDDIQFSEIVVRSSGDAYKILPTGLHPTEGQYRKPQKRSFVIPGLANLAPASEVHLQALTPRSRRIVGLYALAVLGLAFPFFCYKTLRRQK